VSRTLQEKYTSCVSPNTFSSLISYLLFDRNSRGEYENAIAKITAGKSVTTEIQGRKISIKGLYRVGSSFIADGSLIASDQNFLRIFQGRTAGEVSLGLIKLKPGSDANQTVGLYQITRSATSLPLIMPITRIIQTLVLTIVRVTKYSRKT